MKCRFRYRDVPKKSYDLDAATILAMSDQELNQVVPLKKMAPYRGESGKKEKKWKNWEVEWKQKGPERKGRKGKWEPEVKWNKGTGPEEGRAKGEPPCCWLRLMLGGSMACRAAASPG